MPKDRRVRRQLFHESGGGATHGRSGAGEAPVMRGARGAVGAAIAGLALLLAGCGIPRDSEETSKKVRERGTVRLGTVAGESPDPGAERALARLRAVTGARIERSSGPAEALLADLEKGRFDLVFGRFPADSPWSTHVHLGRQPGAAEEPPSDQPAPRFAYRNGENGWIALVERAGAGEAGQ